MNRQALAKAMTEISLSSEMKEGVVRNSKWLVLKNITKKCVVFTTKCRNTFGCIFSDQKFIQMDIRGMYVPTQ